MSYNLWVQWMMGTVNLSFDISFIIQLQGSENFRTSDYVVSVTWVLTLSDSCLLGSNGHLYAPPGLGVHCRQGKRDVRVGRWGDDYKMPFSEHYSQGNQGLSTTEDDSAVCTRTGPSTGKYGGAREPAPHCWTINYLIVSEKGGFIPFSCVPTGESSRSTESSQWPYRVSWLN